LAPEPMEIDPPAPPPQGGFKQYSDWSTTSVRFSMIPIQDIWRSINCFM
jgi:hypothetical protein